jgi:hypothetical protein
MAVRLLTEHIILLRDVTTLPCIPRRRGKAGKLHPSTAWRWAMKGVRGIRLEVLRAGGVLCTSTEAVQRFFELLAEIPGLESAKPAEAGTDAAEVERQLDTLGVRDGEVRRTSGAKGSEHTQLEGT